MSSIRQRLRSISRPSSASRSPTPPTVLPSTTTVTNNTLQSSNTHYNQHPHPHPRQTSSPPRPALAPLPGQRRTLSSESNPAANGNTHSPVAGMPWGWPDPDAEQRRAMLGKQIVPNQATLLDDRPPLPTKTPIPTTTPGLSVPGRRRPQPTSVIQYVICYIIDAEAASLAHPQPHALLPAADAARKRLSTPIPPNGVHPSHSHNSHLQTQHLLHPPPPVAVASITLHPSKTAIRPTSTPRSPPLNSATDLRTFPYTRAMMLTVRTSVLWHYHPSGALRPIRRPGPHCPARPASVAADPIQEMIPTTPVRYARITVRRCAHASWQGPGDRVCLRTATRGLRRVEARVPLHRRVRPRAKISSDPGILDRTLNSTPMWNSELRSREMPVLVDSYLAVWAWE